MFDGFGCVALLLIDLAEHVEALGVDVSIAYPSRRKGNYPFLYVVKSI
jgi:hypothetical protein